MNSKLVAPRWIDNATLWIQGLGSITRCPGLTNSLCPSLSDYFLRIRRRFSVKTLKAKAEKQAAWQEPWEHQLWDAVGPVSWHNVGMFSKGFSLSDMRFWRLLSTCKPSSCSCRFFLPPWKVVELCRLLMCIGASWQRFHQRLFQRH